jgi:ABC-type polysaccharide/polyol phosphate transport system, ATPase component
MTLADISVSFKIKRGKFSHDKYEALKNVSFDLYKGETLGVVGRNGAGKSTLLKVLANIIKPDSGTIITPTPLSISLLSLQLGFSQELSGRDNAIMGALLLGHSRSEAEEKLPSIVEYSELSERINDPMKTYSSGMRARLGFAISTIMSPDVLLIDEALGVGDESFRLKSTDTMKEKMKSGQTIVFVSHVPNAVVQLCTRAIWMEYGQMIMEGAPKNVIKAYQASNQT